MKYLPKAKSKNIVVQNLKDEVLIYDLKADRAFCLNATAGKVFNSCDGQTTFEQLKTAAQLTDAVIYLALDQLQKKNLLASEYVSPFMGLSRRETIRKVGLATLSALPMISMLVAPPAAHAASGQNRTAACQPCTQPSNCASGRCVPAARGSGSICSNGSQTNAAARPGESIDTADYICPSYGTGYCCSGSASVSAPSRCTCDPVP